LPLQRASAAEERPVKPRIALLALAIVGSLAITACKRTPTPPSPAPGAPAAAPAGETADQFVARVNEEFRAISAELNAAQWLSNTYINGDSEMLAAKANERYLTQLNAGSRRRSASKASRFRRTPRARSSCSS
jgi:peptidyl-dipeptidase A